MLTRLHITLTGFSGTGKTTVAALVAARLGWEVVDADDVIEAQAGRAVPDIIAEDGETAFRAIEASVFADLASRERIIVASGGGALALDTGRNLQR